MMEDCLGAPLARLANDAITLHDDSLKRAS